MRSLLISVIAALLLAGCASVDVTKTAKGYHEPTNPNDVEILFTRPNSSYTELAAVSVTGFSPNQTAKMHNALRQKTAAFGASAVLITNQGIDANRKLWATGVAITERHQPFLQNSR